MKHYMHCLLIVLGLINTSLHAKLYQRSFPEEVQCALEKFKSNLFEEENFSCMIASFTDEVKQDFNEMIEDVWSLFGKIQEYCCNQFVDNALFEKYKKFVRKSSISGNIVFSLEDKDFFMDEMTKNMLLHDLELEIQPFCETLTIAEQEEYRNMMRNLCAFFGDIALECEAIMKHYRRVEKAIETSLNEHQVLRIECGLEYPFPSLVYILG